MKKQVTGDHSIVLSIVCIARVKVDGAKGPRKKVHLVACTLRRSSVLLAQFDKNNI